MSTNMLENRFACVSYVMRQLRKKEFNSNRHYETKHTAYSNFKGELRKKKMEALKKNLVKGQPVFSKRSDTAENNTRASFAVSALIVKAMKPFSDGEFVKEFIMAVVKIVCPEKKHLFPNISLSARTITRRIETLSSDVKRSLKDRCRNFEFFSIALDESVDVKDTAQLAVFVRGVNSEFEIL